MLTERNYMMGLHFAGDSTVLCSVNSSASVIKLYLPILLGKSNSSLVILNHTPVLIEHELEPRNQVKSVNFDSEHHMAKACAYLRRQC